MTNIKLNGTRDMAIRINNAENRFCEWVIEMTDCTRQEAEKVLRVFKKAKAVKISVNDGQFIMKHGAFCDAEVMRRAIAL